MERFSHAFGYLQIISMVLTSFLGLIVFLGLIFWRRAVHFVRRDLKRFTFPLKFNSLSAKFTNFLLPFPVRRLPLSSTAELVLMVRRTKQIFRRNRSKAPLLMSRTATIPLKRHTGNSFSIKNFEFDINKLYI